jgi:hypothetical protein
MFICAIIFIVIFAAFYYFWKKPLPKATEAPTADAVPAEKGKDRDHTNKNSV